MHQYDQLLQQLNARIWDYAELKFDETQSAAAMEDILEQNGFRVTRGIAGMPTAYIATAGSGKPVIGLLAEYDALSGLSQQAGVAHPAQRSETPNGHGCGHNLLGTASIGAALMVRDLLKEKHLSGTIALIGCPAEEGGSGKAYLARAGVFDKLDIALTWHPASTTAIMTGSMQANCQAYFRFKGKSAHAAAAPHLGRSALDAVELMDVGVNYMREHMEPTDRVHYAVVDTGGISPNVVQNHAEVLYLIRSTETEKVEKLYERVCKIAQGAAMMTETEVEIIFDKACSNTLSNEVLEQLLYRHMLAEPMPTYGAEDLTFAREIKSTLHAEDLSSDLGLFALPKRQKQQFIEKLTPELMADFVVPYQHLEVNVPGSSDVGDCSHVVPTAQFVAACAVPGTPAHSWQMVAQGKSNLAVQGMLWSARVLASAALEAFEKPDIIAAAKKEFQEVTGGKPYHCPIPADIAPNSTAQRRGK